MKKRVLLLGDSIRMGYQADVKSLLEPEFDVFYDAEDNGRFAAYTLWQANQMYKHFGPFDIVHWNNGYWDCNVEAPMKEAMHPIDEYVHFLRRIIHFCRDNGSKVIFATTCPIWTSGNSMDNTGTGASLSYDNDWVARYNDAASKLMEEEHVPIDDLYSLCLKGPRYYKCDDMLHPGGGLI